MLWKLTTAEAQRPVKTVVRVSPTHRSIEDRVLTMGTLVFYYYQGAYCCRYWYYFSTIRRPIVLA
jgi:hypothetical protein